MLLLHIQEWIEKKKEKIQCNKEKEKNLIDKGRFKKKNNNNKTTIITKTKWNEMKRTINNIIRKSHPVSLLP